MPDLQLAAEAIAERITPRTRIVFICNPNNPTGALFPRSAMERAADGAAGPGGAGPRRGVSGVCRRRPVSRPGVPGHRRAGQSDTGAQHGQGLRSGRCAVRIRNHGPGHRGAAAPRPPAVRHLHPGPGGGPGRTRRCRVPGAHAGAQPARQAPVVRRMRAPRPCHRTVSRQLRAGGRGAGRTRRGTAAVAAGGDRAHSAAPRPGPLRAREHRYGRADAALHRRSRAKPSATPTAAPTARNPRRRAVRSLPDWRASDISTGLRTRRRGWAESDAARRRFRGGSEPCFGWPCAVGYRMSRLRRAGRRAGAAGGVRDQSPGAVRAAVAVAGFRRPRAGPALREPEPVRPRGRRGWSG